MRDVLCHYPKRVAGSAEVTGSKMPREWERQHPHKAAGKQVCHRGRISVPAAGGFERYLRQMTFSWSCSNSTILKHQQTGVSNMGAGCGRTVRSVITLKGKVVQSLDDG